MGSEAEKQATFEGLASTSSHLRSRVARALRLRVAPEIQFREDQSVARAARIESLLAEIKTGSAASAEPPSELARLTRRRQRRLRARMSARPEGLLLVDKPAGVTSHDVVQIVRRAYGERSIGHLGTLDPFATGLLILLVGRSTRLATFIVTEPKVYEADDRFGAETDTDDCTGSVIREAGVPSDAAIDAAIPSLTGTIMQVPPAYSAKSVDGTRAYDAATTGNRSRACAGESRSPGLGTSSEAAGRSGCCHHLWNRDLHSCARTRPRQGDRQRGTSFCIAAHAERTVRRCGSREPRRAQEVGPASARV